MSSLSLLYDFWRSCAFLLTCRNLKELRICTIAIEALIPLNRLFFPCENVDWRRDSFYFFDFFNVIFNFIHTSAHGQTDSKQGQIRKNIECRGKSRTSLGTPLRTSLRTSLPFEKSNFELIELSQLVLPFRIYLLSIQTGSFIAPLPLQAKHHLYFLYPCRYLSSFFDSWDPANVTKTPYQAILHVKLWESKLLSSLIQKRHSQFE